MSKEVFPFLVGGLMPPATRSVLVPFSRHHLGSAYACVCTEVNIDIHICMRTKRTNTTRNAVRLRDVTGDQTSRPSAGLLLCHPLLPWIYLPDPVIGKGNWVFSFFFFFFSPTLRFWRPCSVAR